MYGLGTLAAEVEPARDVGFRTKQSVWHALGNRTVSRLPVEAHYSAH